MLHKCANPKCPTPFRRLNHGKLFLIEIDHPLAVPHNGVTTLRKKRSARRMERYWLCDDCSSLLTLTFQRGRGMVTVPLPVRNTLPPRLHLRHVPAGTESGRVELKGTL
jgi:hypothetical protein